MELIRDDGLVLSDDPSRIDLDQVKTWLAEAYWAKARTDEQIERSFRNSRPYGVYAPGGTQVALTRVTTDLATFCWIGDVYVDEAWRGKGIGHWLVGAVVRHVEESGCNRFLLATKDAHGVYTDLGFTPLALPSIWMELDKRPPAP